MGFDGVVFAEHLRKSSISNSVSLKDRVIKSINAGADVLVFDNYFADNASMPHAIYQIIYDAVKNKTISEKRILDSYLRIEKLKKTL